MPRERGKENWNKHLDIMYCMSQDRYSFDPIFDCKPQELYDAIVWAREEIYRLEQVIESLQEDSDER